MMKVIKTGTENYFYDKVTNNLIERYDPDNENLVLVVAMENGSILNVENKKINYGYGGQIYFEYDDDKYIIDDGYQDLLIRAGYIVMNNYDQKQIEEKEFGISIRNKFQQYILEIIEKMWDTKEYDNFKVENNFKDIKVSLEKDNFRFTMYIDTVNSIVNKNQQRKVNRLPFYPFIKDMDKYGTMYLSIFCEKLEATEEINKKYEIAENMVIKLIELLNEYSRDDKYRFERIIIKKRINNYPGI